MGVQRVLWTLLHLEVLQPLDLPHPAHEDPPEAADRALAELDGLAEIVVDFLVSLLQAPSCHATVNCVADRADAFVARRRWVKIRRWTLML